MGSQEGLDALLSALSLLLTGIDLDELGECDEFLNGLQRLLVILTAQEASLTAVEAQSSLSLLTVIITMSQEHDSLSALCMSIWRSYVKVVRRWGSCWDRESIGPVLDVLMGFAQDGIRGLRTSDIHSSAAQADVDGFNAQRFKLLQFFVQRVAATVVHCRRQLDVDACQAAIDIVFAFYGISHSLSAMQDPNLQQVVNCRQSLLRILVLDSDRQKDCCHNAVDSCSQDIEISQQFLLQLNREWIAGERTRYLSSSAGGCSREILRGKQHFIGWAVEQLVHSLQTQSMSDDTASWSLLIFLSNEMVLNSSILMLMVGKATSELEHLSHFALAVCDLVCSDPRHLCILDEFVGRAVALAACELPLSQLSSQFQALLVGLFFRQFDASDQLCLFRRAMCQFHQSRALLRSQSREIAQRLSLLLIQLIRALHEGNQLVAIDELSPALPGVGGELLAEHLVSHWLMPKGDFSESLCCTLPKLLDNMRAPNEYSLPSDACIASFKWVSLMHSLQRSATCNMRSDKVWSVVQTFVNDRSLGSKIVRRLSTLARHLDLFCASRPSLNVSEVSAVIEITKAMSALAYLLSMHAVPKGVLEIVRTALFAAEKTAKQFAQFLFSSSSLPLATRTLYCQAIDSCFSCCGDISTVIVKSPAWNSSVTDFEGIVSFFNQLWQRRNALGSQSWKVLRTVCQVLQQMIADCPSSCLQHLVRLIDKSLFPFTQLTGSQDVSISNSQRGLTIQETALGTRQFEESFTPRTLFHSGDEPDLNSHPSKRIRR